MNHALKKVDEIICKYTPQPYF